jgi:hypothetical protein
VAEQINFKDTRVLAGAVGYIDCLVKVTEIRLHLDIFNRDAGFLLSRSWYPAMNIVKHMRGHKKHCKSGPSTSNMYPYDLLHVPHAVHARTGQH